MSAETTAAPAPSSGSAIDNFFKLAERGTSIGTEARAGVTTFMVMAYIIFLNPNILMAGFEPPASESELHAGRAGRRHGADRRDHDDRDGRDRATTRSRSPPGLGINAIVAFSLTGRGLSPAGAMGVIVWEGIVVTILVLVGFREAVMNAVPLALKKAIGVGIGLFILFIGFANGGFVIAERAGDAGDVQAARRRRPTSCSGSA